jgi:hypothetical protein
MQQPRAVDPLPHSGCQSASKSDPLLKCAIASGQIERFELTIAAGLPEEAYQPEVNRVTRGTATIALGSYVGVGAYRTWRRQGPDWSPARRFTGRSLSPRINTIMPSRALGRTPRFPPVETRGTVYWVRARSGANALRDTLMAAVRRGYKPSAPSPPLRGPAEALGGVWRGLGQATPAGVGWGASARIRHDRFGSC